MTKTTMPVLVSLTLTRLQVCAETHETVQTDTLHLFRHYEVLQLQRQSAHRLKTDRARNRILQCVNVCGMEKDANLYPIANQ